LPLCPSCPSCLVHPISFDTIGVYGNEHQLRSFSPVCSAHGDKEHEWRRGATSRTKTKPTTGIKCQHQRRGLLSASLQPRSSLPAVQTNGRRFTTLTPPFDALFPSVSPKLPHAMTNSFGFPPFLPSLCRSLGVVVVTLTDCFLHSTLPWCTINVILCGTHFAILFYSALFFIATTSTTTLCDNSTQ